MTVKEAVAQYREAKAEYKKASADMKAAYAKYPRASKMPAELWIQVRDALDHTRYALQEAKQDIVNAAFLEYPE